jgi:ribosomal protein L24
VVLVRYPLHAPEPDPLSGPASEGRFGFYEGTVRQLPAVLVNGKLAVPARGGKDDAPERYDEFVSAVEPLLETAPKAKLKLSATRTGDKVSITADVSALEETGDDIRLRVVLVESEVAYKGKGGVPVQINIARALPAGEEGVVLNKKVEKKTWTVDVAELRKKLEAHLKKHEEKRPFPDKERPLDLKKLRVVAFIQNDQTAEVFQAAQADVKGELAK